MVEHEHERKRTEQPASPAEAKANRIRINAIWVSLKSLSQELYDLTAPTPDEVNDASCEARQDIEALYDPACISGRVWLCSMVEQFREVDEDGEDGEVDSNLDGDTPHA